MGFNVWGPKGGPVLKNAPIQRVRASLAGLVKRFGRVTVTEANSEALVRQAIVRYCRWGIANEPSVHYAQTRPIPLAQRRRLPLRTDCSGFATCAYKDAGAPDPNGNGYDGSGFTGTMLAHGRKVALRNAKAGDLVVFGSFPGHHVCVLLEDGANGNPLLCSHGQEKGPFAIRLLEEQTYQPRPSLFLTYLGALGV